MRTREWRIPRRFRLQLAKSSIELGSVHEFPFLWFLQSLHMPLLYAFWREQGMGGEVKVFEFLRLAHLQFHVVNLTIFTQFFLLPWLCIVNIPVLTIDSCNKSWTLLLQFRWNVEVILWLHQEYSFASVCMLFNACIWKLSLLIHFSFLDSCKHADHDSYRNQLKLRIQMP